MAHFNPMPSRPRRSYGLDFSFHDSEDLNCACDMCLIADATSDDSDDHWCIYSDRLNKRLAFLEQLKHQMFQTVSPVHTLTPFSDESIKILILEASRYKGQDTWLTSFIKEHEDAFWDLVVPIFHHNSQEGYDYEFIQFSTAVKEIVKLQGKVDIDFLYPVLIVAQAFALRMIKPGK